MVSYGYYAVSYLNLIFQSGPSGDTKGHFDLPTERDMRAITNRPIAIAFRRALQQNQIVPAAKPRKYI
jgi:hypothetical protein